MSLHAEYVRLIAELDKVIAGKRTLLLNATTPDDRVKWKNGIDDSLDERIRLMKRRDAAKENGL